MDVLNLEECDSLEEEDSDQGARNQKSAARGSKAKKDKDVVVEAASGDAPKTD